MKLNLECIYCNIKKADKMYSQYDKNQQNKLDFMKKVFSIINNTDDEDTSPFLSSNIMRLLNEELKLDDIYYDIKRYYNNFLLSIEDDILKKIYDSEDILFSALKYAMIGNFIDFGAMDEVDKDKLKDLIENALNQEIDLNSYRMFLEELNNINKIAYLVDNAGEIVFDKIFISIIKELYPDIDINVIVRGEPIYNDATIIDAKQISLCDIVSVIDNGTDIPGTQLNKINKKSKEIINNADLIISKGQGNFESLFGCNKNIYYIFLCKCDLFVKRFDIEKFQGVFSNEKDIKDLMI